MSSSDDRDRQLREWMAHGPPGAPAELRRQVLDVDRWPRQRRPWFGRWTAPSALVWLPATLATVLIVALASQTEPVRDLLARIGAFPPPKTVTVADALGTDLGFEGSAAVASAFGDIWVATEGDELRRLDPDAGALKRTFGLPGRACGPLVEGHGALWIPLCIGDGPRGLTGTLIRITPDGQWVEVGIPGTASLGPEIAFDGAGVWIVADGPSGRLVHLGTDGATPLGEIRLGVEARNLLLAAGSLWVSGGRDEVLRIDPESGAVQATVRTGPGADFLAEADGAIWVANRRGGSVTRIDPISLDTVELTVDPGPMQLLADGGRLWVLTTETVDLIDVRRQAVVSRVAVGGHLTTDCCGDPVALSVYSIARHGDDLWFAAPTHLYRLEVDAIAP
jgi:streptogramin lyase